MRKRSRFLLLLAAAALAAGTAAQEAGHDRHDHDDDATTRHRFDDVDRWVEAFEDPSRQAWQQPERVVAALGIQPGMAVADIGAGTGYFNPWLSRAVGPRGRVLALDTEAGLVAHMNERAGKEATPNVTARQCAPDDPGLEQASVDRILIVNTFHHFDDRLDYFGRLRRALRPGGTVAIVDFKKEELPVGPPLDHKLPRDQIVAEMQAAGYALVGEPDFLPYQNFLIFGVAPE